MQNRWAFAHRAGVAFTGEVETSERPTAPRANGEMSVGSLYGEPHRKDPQVVREREEVLTAPRALLLRRAELIRVRAEHAAVTLPRLEHGSAVRTSVEMLTGVLGHRLAPRRSAFRTRDRRLGDGHRAKLARAVPKRRRGAREGRRDVDRDPHFAPHGYGSSSLPPRKQHCGTGFMSPASAGVTSPLTRRVTGRRYRPGRSTRPATRTLFASALVVSRARELVRRTAGFQPEFWPQGQTNKATPFSAPTG
jgi:hypothetical protein